MAIDYERRKRTNKIILSVTGGLILIAIVVGIIGKNRENARWKAWEKNFTKNSEKQHDEYVRSEQEKDRVKATHDSMMVHDSHYRDSMNTRNVVSKIDSARRWLGCSVTLNGEKGRFHQAKITASNESLVAFDKVVVEYSYERDGYVDKSATDTVEFARVNPNEGKYLEKSIGLTRHKAPFGFTSRIISATVDKASMVKAKKENAQYYKHSRL